MNKLGNWLIGKTLSDLIYRKIITVYIACSYASVSWMVRCCDDDWCCSCSVGTK